MDAHFWPSVYPAILVGLLVGLGQGGLLNIVLGAIGGTLGGFLMLMVLKALSLDNGAIAAILTIGAGGLAALALARASQLLSRKKAKTPS